MTFKRPMKGVSLLPSNIETTDENILVAMKKLKYPVMVTTKLDGIRAIRLNYNGKPSLLSYRLKEIPNTSIREHSLRMPSGFDMELWCPSLPYNSIESIVMSEEHPDSDKIGFCPIDLISDKPYHERIKQVLSFIQLNTNANPLEYIPQRCDNAEELFQRFLQSEQLGQEGIVFRTPNSPYKQGRSTLREQWMVKLCRWSYEEATIVGFQEQMENTNEEKHNAIGLMDRSKTLAGQEGKGTLGAFVCAEGFNVGTGVGLTNRLRQEIWDNQSKYIGRTIKYKCKPHGQKDKPRSPIFWGFRNKEMI